MGIDASLNSTGIIVLADKEETYYIIKPHVTKNQKKDPHIHYVEYNKTEDKVESLNNYISTLYSIIQQYELNTVVMENVPFAQGSSSVVDLALINGAIRCLCYMLGIECVVVFPGVWKKDTLCNGAADKEYITYNFKMLKPVFKEYTTKQINDIADAFFIAKWFQWGGEQIKDRVEILDDEKEN